MAFKYQISIQKKNKKQIIKRTKNKMMPEPPPPLPSRDPLYNDSICSLNFATEKNLPLGIPTYSSVIGNKIIFLLPCLIHETHVADIC